MIHTHSLTVEKTGHYYTLGKPGTSIKRFWIVCHGYGQRADRFLSQFQLLDKGDNFILAPEGLHRFYWQGMSGDVVASWMTKQDRESDIEDYTKFIHGLYQQYLPKLSPDVEIILFGFSQGTATQCRWITKVLPRFDHLILWAGLMPKDIDYQPLASYFSDKKIHFVYGDKDQYLKPEYLEEQSNFVAQQNLDISEWKFEGKHETRKKVLLEFYQSHLGY